MTKTNAPKAQEATPAMLNADYVPVVVKEERKAACKLAGQDAKSKVVIDVCDLSLPHPAAFNPEIKPDASYKDLDALKDVTMPSPFLTVAWSAIVDCLVSLQREGTTKGTHQGKQPIEFESVEAAQAAVTFTPRYPDLASAEGWQEFATALTSKGSFGRISEAQKLAAFNVALDAVLDVSKPIQSATKKTLVVLLSSMAGTPTPQGWASYLQLPTTAYDGDKLQRLVDFIAGECVPALIEALRAGDRVSGIVADELEQGLALAMSDSDSDESEDDLEALDF